MASDLAFALDRDDDLRILPVLGKGAGQNAYDVRFLKGIDLAFVRTDTLDQLRLDRRLVNIERRLCYVARLFNDELHVLASSEVKLVSELQGKKVSFDVKGSGSDYTGRAMFSALGIAVEPVNVDQPTALEMLRRGELSAVVSVAAKPVAVVAGFDPQSRFHLLEVPFPENLPPAYLPASINASDYPKLIPEKAEIRTLAVGSILAAYAWPAGTDRAKRLTLFVDAFFSNFDRLLAPSRHPKWREVNLNATVPGWLRLPAAQEWLDRHPVSQAATAPASRSGVSQFLTEAQPLPTTDKDRLYEEFLKWRAENASTRR
jgi:hypothetical protein